MRFCPCGEHWNKGNVVNYDFTTNTGTQVSVDLSLIVCVSYNEDDGILNLYLPNRRDWMSFHVGPEFDFVGMRRAFDLVKEVILENTKRIGM